MKELKKYNLEEIKKILPHREPILLADSGALYAGSENGDLSPSDYSAETLFFVDPEMNIFKGHFPDNPTFPGAYITEAMAQCADLLILSLPENEGKTFVKPYLASVQNLRFMRPVLPGSKLKMRAALVSSSSDQGMYECAVTAEVDTMKAAQGRITICLK